MEAFVAQLLYVSICNLADVLDPSIDRFALFSACYDLRAVWCVD